MKPFSFQGAGLVPSMEPGQHTGPLAWGEPPLSRTLKPLLRPNSYKSYIHSDGQKCSRGQDEIETYRFFQDEPKTMHTLIEY